MKTQLYFSLFVAIFCVTNMFCLDASAQTLKQIGKQKKSEAALIEAFVNLEDVPEPFGSQLAELKQKFDDGKIKDLQQL
ncbi:MAG: hypothetical protein ACRC2T_00430, partial [Thermoguttaceae bacterium]